MEAAGRRAAFVAFAIVLLAGCPAASIKTHPIVGKVELKDGDVELLKGSHVELRQETDPLILPSGRITAGGTFTVQTLYQGEILSGAPEGKYKARIILGDESDEGVPKRPPNLLHPRFLDFDKSGLTFTVPSSDYSVSLSRK